MLLYSFEYFTSFTIDILDPFNFTRLSAVLFLFSVIIDFFRYIDSVSIFGPSGNLSLTLRY